MRQSSSQISPFTSKSNSVWQPHHRGLFLKPVWNRQHARTCCSLSYIFGVGLGKESGRGFAPMGSDWCLVEMLVSQAAVLYFDLIPAWYTWRGKNPCVFWYPVCLKWNIGIGWDMWHFSNCSLCVQENALPLHLGRRLEKILLRNGDSSFVVELGLKKRKTFVQMGIFILVVTLSTATTSVRASEVFIWAFCKDCHVPYPKPQEVFPAL